MAISASAGNISQIGIDVNVENILADRIKLFCSETSAFGNEPLSISHANTLLALSNNTSVSEPLRADFRSQMCFSNLIGSIF